MLLCIVGFGAYWCRCFDGFVLVVMLLACVRVVFALVLALFLVVCVSCVCLF